MAIALLSPVNTSDDEDEPHPGKTSVVCRCSGGYGGVKLQHHPFWSDNFNPERVNSAHF